VLIPAATAVTATFTLDAYALSVTRDGTGAGTVTSSPAGIDCGATCSASYDYGTAVTLTATPATGSTFAGWSGGGCSGTGACTVTVAAATDVTATFTLATHALTVAKAGNGSGSSVVTSSPAGINCGTDCSEPFVYGTAVTLTAAPATGATFSGWSGGGCSGTGACTVTVTAATTVTATFTLNQYTLTVIKSGSGGGSVVSLPPGISCGGTCTGTFSHGTIVRLSATPAMFSIFGGWSGGGCSGTGMCNVTMTGPVTVGANFQRPTFTLAVSKTGVGVGTVTGSPGTINCGTSCSQAVLSGTTVTLTATPSANSTFNGWSGGGCTGTAPCTLTVTATTTVTATFFLTATSVPARRELRARGPDQ
jgi:hypothetical protein